MTPTSEYRVKVFRQELLYSRSSAGNPHEVKFASAANLDDQVNEWIAAGIGERRFLSVTSPGVSPFTPTDDGFRLILTIAVTYELLERPADERRRSGHERTASATVRFRDNQRQLPGDEP